MRYRLLLEVHPDDNPELGLPDVIQTSRMISCGFGGGRPYTGPHDLAELRYELETAYRSIEHLIERWQKGEVQGP